MYTGDRMMNETGVVCGVRVQRKLEQLAVNRGLSRKYITIIHSENQVRKRRWIHRGREALLSQQFESK